MNMKRIVTATLFAGTLLAAPAKNMRAQSFWCAWSGYACCICDQDWWGYFWCYEDAFVGWYWCDAYYTYCVLQDPFCYASGPDAIAPDGSIYATRSLNDDGAKAAWRTIKIADGAEWTVACRGMIARRKYTADALADLRRRLDNLVL